MLVVVILSGMMKWPLTCHAMLADFKHVEVASCGDSLAVPKLHVHCMLVGALAVQPEVWVGLGSLFPRHHH